MGLPSVITSDQGGEFHNHLNSQLMVAFGIDHRLTTPYHPQANGLDERYNQTLINSLSKFVQEDRTTWEERLGEVVYAYNTAVQESTKHTPFEVMFGRVARLPVESTNADPESRVEQFIAADDMDEEERAVERKELEEDVRKNIAVAQEKQKRYYDLKHGAASCFKVGSVVLKKDFTRKRRRGGKMDYRWEGPFRVTKSCGRGLFQLTEIQGVRVCYNNYVVLFFAVWCMTLFYKKI